MSLKGWRATVSAKTSWVFITLTDGEGVEGVGEATLFGAEAELGALVQGLSDSLAAQPAQGVNEILARLGQAQMGLARCALCAAIEQAGMDLLARRLGAPLSALLGGACRAAVPFYANINRGITDRSAEGFATQALQILSATGAQALKIAPFDGLRWDQAAPDAQARLFQAGMDRVAAVRAAVPTDTRLLVDCHARFDPALARRAIRALAAQDVYWIEEPCDMARLAPQEQRALRHLANDHGLRLAGGETVTRLDEMAQLLAAGGHDVVLPDLRCTGIAGGCAMLRLAVDTGVAASLHNPVGPVLDAVSTQIAAALPSFLILERQVGESDRFDTIRGAPVAIEDGAVTLPGTPGLGFRPDLSTLEPLSPGTSDTPISFAGMAGAGPDA
ncbi:mandelate racemase/muconate lactonizing enzyme family protein [Mameliella sp.]|uniref:mandelate racemase/muconate lactonizing enzyme family protein n=1 Tax=Mameliella sp. TaxID=1924940 RepID=UPI003BAB1157